MLRRLAVVSLLAFCVVAAAEPALAQRRAAGAEASGKLVQLDFADVELSAVIETIARLTGKNFIYDDRVRGRVTIVSPSQVTVEQAYAVFESVLQVKGFTTVEGPGGVIKVIPVREAKESSIETVTGAQPSPKRDHFVTRLIPLRYIDAQDIATTLKPLVSKDAALVAYPPTNTLILTDSSSNIRRLLQILESIDVSSYREELAVIPIEYADAATLGAQISEIYGAEVSAVPGVPTRRTTRRTAAARTEAGPSTLAPGIRVRIIPDERTNSLLVLAPRPQIADVRELVRKLDVPVEGGGRIRVYYLKHADAEELAQTLNALLSGQRGGPSAGVSGAAPAAVPALRAAVTELAEGVTLTADPGTNSLVIQASKEAYDTLVAVIEQLDIQRPQVLVEALIMEVLVNDSTELGYSGLVQILGGVDITLQQATDAATASALDLVAPGASIVSSGVPESTLNFGRVGDDTVIQGILRAIATDGNTNVLAAPHILTSDNEEAEIKIGNNIPIITSRVEAASGTVVPEGGQLASSVNVERQDIGVTLRVTPQISEGDTLRMTIFQEITNVDETLTGVVSADSGDSGVALTNRRIDNTLVVRNGETVVIGGLISEDLRDNVDKVPFLGDIPYLGWAFKTVDKSVTKTNLIVFLTPHIIRSQEDLDRLSIQKREEFAERAEVGLQLKEDEREAAEEAGLDLAMVRGSNAVRAAVVRHRERYPIERMKALEARPDGASSGLPADSDGSGGASGPRPRYALRAGVFADEGRAMELLTRLVDGGHDGSLITTEADGTLLYEVSVGPYQALEDARAAAALLRGSFGIDPDVAVVAPAPDEDGRP